LFDLVSLIVCPVDNEIFPWLVFVHSLSLVSIFPVMFPVFCRNLHGSENRLKST
jgi:hypothetical protein